MVGHSQGFLKRLPGFSQAPERFLKFVSVVAIILRIWQNECLEALLSAPLLKIVVLNVF